MRAARFVLPVLLLAACAASLAIARTVPEVQAMVEAKASGALAAAEALTKDSPNDANAWVLLTRARLQAKQAEKAIAAGDARADIESRQRFTPRHAHGAPLVGSNKRQVRGIYQRNRTIRKENTHLSVIDD